MKRPPDILEKILNRKREEVAERSERIGREQLEQLAASMPQTRGFYNAVKSCVDRGDTAVIAEIKRASPSKGLIRADFAPTEIAASYARGGAACLSVLTDQDFFQGSDDYLRQARGACTLPVLRKDFIVDPYQVIEARAIGADAILLICAALDQQELSALYQLARSLELDVLIEAHDRSELEQATACGARLIGINNRNLRTFETRLQTTIELREQVPESAIVVTESGIQSDVDVALMRSHGVHAFLVGEAFMRAADPGTALRTLFSR